MTSPLRQDIMDLLPEDLSDWLQSRGEAPYRAQQILKWVYVHQTDSFDSMTDIGKPLKRALADGFIIPRLAAESVETSADGSRKYLFRMQDEQAVEAVLIPEKAHMTLCISSQVGCAQGCRFCLTGKGGFTRDLTAGEIIAQVRDIMALNAAESGPRLTNLVLMGMGEPLANYANVARALRIITDGHIGLKVSTRRVTLSTAGLVPGIRRMGQEMDINLAISLNATDNKTRSHLMPINRKYPLETLMAACREYPLKPRQRITFEYILIRDVNDSDDNARALAALLRPIRAKINLIPFNPHPGSPFAVPEPARIEQFQRILIDRHYTAVIRYSKGQDISAACGQLYGKRAGIGL